MTKIIGQPDLGLNFPCKYTDTSLLSTRPDTGCSFFHKVLDNLNPRHITWLKTKRKCLMEKEKNNRQKTYKATKIIIFYIDIDLPKRRKRTILRAIKHIKRKRRYLRNALRANVRVVVSTVHNSAINIIRKRAERDITLTILHDTDYLGIIKTGLDVPNAQKV